MNNWRSAALVGLVLSVGAAIWLTLLVAGGSTALLAFDSEVFQAVRAWADPLHWPVRASAVLGALTSPALSTIWAVLCAVILWRRHHPVFAQVLICSGLLGVLTSETVKRLVDRTRPETAVLHRSDLTLSFPSGHAMAGIYLYTLLGVLLIGMARGRASVRILGWALIVLGPLIGISRVVLGVHWPSDVLGGWCYGCAVALGCGLAFWSRLAAVWTSRVSTTEAAPAAVT